MKKFVPKVPKWPYARSWAGRIARAHKPKRGPYRRVCPAYVTFPREVKLA